MQLSLVTCAAAASTKLARPSLQFAVSNCQMGYMSAEEVTLPARFLTTTAHFIAILTIVFDAKTLAGQILLTESSGVEAFTSAQQDAVAQQLSSAAYAAIACLAVEYLGLFMGVSLFLRAHNCLYIILHFAGAIVTGLMYTQAWSGAALVGFVIAFNCLPAALELLTFLYVARVSFFVHA